MQFVRAVLYGFTPERRKRYLPPVNGGQPGGRLRVANEFGTFTVHRHGERHRSARRRRAARRSSTTAASRATRRSSTTLLAGVDEPTYNNVFAVGLKEIQELGSLDDTAAADYLYRLTSGLDRVSLIDVIREVEAARERLLGNRRRSLVADSVQLLARRDKLRAQIEELRRQDAPLERRWPRSAAT